MPLSPHEDPAAIARTTAVVVGAGPAGLSVATCLAHAHVPFLVLEQSDTVAASWRRHYDVGTIGLIKEGKIAVFPGIERFAEDGVVFADGRRERVDAVIAATGYQPRVDALLPGAASTFSENGVPMSSGMEASIPGLFYCGYRISPTGMLRDIAREARQIGNAIARASARA